MKISVIIPAHNEEKYIGACLESVKVAAAPYCGAVEIIVVLNRCDDRTEEIALASGAKVVCEDAKCLSKIRNAGVAASCGEMIVTIDADSVMTRNFLMEVDLELSREWVVGGGATIRIERMSLGLAVTGMFLIPYFLVMGISCGAFWCRRSDFDAIGGFDEEILSAEDIDFALRLKRYGKRSGRKFRTIRRGYIFTSCRKFDHFGDWYAIRELPLMLSLLGGKNREGADKVWYDFEH